MGAARIGAAAEPQPPFLMRIAEIPFPLFGGFPAAPPQLRGTRKPFTMELQPMEKVGCP